MRCLDVWELERKERVSSAEWSTRGWRAAQFCRWVGLVSTEPGPLRGEAPGEVLVTGTGGFYLVAGGGLVLTLRMDGHVPVFGDLTFLVYPDRVSRDREPVRPKPLVLRYPDKGYPVYGFRFALFHFFLPLVR